MQTSRLPQRPLARRGFTLIEVLTVIAILSILMAFLLPAVMRAGSNAKVVQVKTEIGNLAAAIATFKQEFGIEPPSRIRLYEAAAGWNNTDTLTVNSRALISRMWPQYDFGTHDLNADGALTGDFTLTGAECLVFFLGGPTTWVDSDGDAAFDSGETVVQAGGFSRNPANPFAPLPASGSGNRLNAFYTFLPDRLITSTNANFFGYVDPISSTSTRAPYLYVNSYEGQGYNTADLGMSAFPANAGMTDAYRNGNAANSPYYNPNGYQLITAGFDGRYGAGGPYQPDGSSKLPAWGSVTAANRLVENDNITNFSSGMLAP